MLKRAVEQYACSFSEATSVIKVNLRSGCELSVVTNLEDDILTMAKDNLKALAAKQKPVFVSPEPPPLMIG